MANFKLVDCMHYMLDNIMTNKSKMKTLQIDLPTMLMVIVYIKLYMTAIKFTLEKLVEDLKFNKHVSEIKCEIIFLQIILLSTF